MYKIFSTLMCLGVLPSCSFVDKGSVNRPAVIQQARTAYVVKPDDSSRDIEKYLETALSNNGLKAKSGSIADKPKQVDLYVEFVDRWTWDMAMYLKSLDVYVRDNRNGQLVGSGKFHQGFMHSFPSPSKKCQEVVDSIFKRGE